MFDISKKTDDRLVLNGKEYQLFLSFDNVLKVFDMWSDDCYPVQIKPQLALVKLTHDADFKAMDFETALEVYIQVFDDYIKSVKANDEVDRYDLEGNVLPKRQRETDEDDKPLYSLKYDGEYIFSSFMQAYHIDLIEEQGKLHWQKFNALLSGLPDGTKLVEVMKIRAWKPQKGDSSKEKQRMYELQEEYALPEE
ncbi:Bacteriophage Gp15 protein [Streptococcus gallolyticus]|uniref:Bacteriophage Gp15 protein n=1 Tax=Streptococcus gallolyticus TaxID=315405 RepID=A0A1I7JHD7_9STRE|nr:bacteriophage Gp15 family protein [Streptococcus gallolyticus]SFC83289.1 Bacteriophage Gp15 protein [Streptococcus gallolyticus]SFU84551.1 Bacteriophage Gp15 protein [Streptococcus gallolyticus]